MVTTQEEILTIEEAAKYLRIPVSTVYRLAQSDRIPCQKVGRHWRFRKETIDHWLDDTIIKSKKQTANDNVEQHGC